MPNHHRDTLTKREPSVVGFSFWLVPMQPAVPAWRYDRFCDSATTGMLDMTKLLQHIDEMRALINQTTTSEQSLVKALGDALSQVDHQLVRDIRKVALEHQARRAEVFLELQALACSIGMFPQPQEVAYVPPANDEQAYFPAIGDWRQAAMNVSFQDEVDYHLNATGAQH
jgi:hypothetical protein